MKTTLISILILIGCQYVVAQSNDNLAAESIKEQKKFNFFRNYEWHEENPKNQDGSIYRVTLTNEISLNGIVAIGKSFDASEAETPLNPFFIGINGWDPVKKHISFLSFNREGLMVQGTIKLVDEHTIQYDYEFGYPGNKRKLEGKDIMKFNTDRTKFTWTFFLRREKNDPFEQFGELYMVRGEKSEGA